MSRLFSLSGLLWSKKEIRILILGLVRSDEPHRMGTSTKNKRRIMLEKLLYYTD